MIPEGLEEELQDINEWASDLAARADTDSHHPQDAQEPFVWSKADVHALASSLQAISAMAQGMAGAGKQLSNHPILKAFGFGA